MLKAALPSGSGDCWPRRSLGWRRDPNRHPPFRIQNAINLTGSAQPLPFWSSNDSPASRPHVVEQFAKVAAVHPNRQFPRLVFRFQYFHPAHPLFYVFYCSKNVDQSSAFPADIRGKLQK